MTTEPVGAPNTIWKFTLEHARRQKISMPASYRILSVGLDREDLRVARVCIWAAVEPAWKPRDVEIIMVATGGVLPHVGDFIGTVRTGNFLWHFFTGPGDSANMSSAGFHYETRNNGNG